jgi:hypothetical protein
MELDANYILALKYLLQEYNEQAGENVVCCVTQPGWAHSIGSKSEDIFHLR